MKAPETEENEGNILLPSVAPCAANPTQSGWGVILSELSAEIFIIDNKQGHCGLTSCWGDRVSENKGIYLSVTDKRLFSLLLYPIGRRLPRSFTSIDSFFIIFGGQYNHDQDLYSVSLTAGKVTHTF